LGLQFVDDFKTFIEWTICPAAVVAGQDADVIAKSFDHANQIPHGANTYVSVQIADVKDSEIIKCRGKIGESQAIFFDKDLICVSTRTAVKSSELQGHSENPRRYVDVFKIELDQSLSEQFGLMLDLDFQPPLDML
jgi:hypothetical protein